MVFPKGHVFEDVSTIFKLFFNATMAVKIAKPLYHYRTKRVDSITETHTLTNLIDYWLAHESLYEFFFNDDRFNTDVEFMNKLLQYCANAVARTWRWCYASSNQERMKYETSLQEMQGFVVQKIPAFGLKKWPFYLRFSIFMCRFKNKYVFALLFYMVKVYRRIIC